NSMIAQQTYTITGTVSSNNEALPFVNVYIDNTSFGAITDENGVFLIKNVPSETYKITASYVGYTSTTQSILVTSDQKISFYLEENQSLNEVVISGTMKSVSKMDSPVPVEIYRPSFFKKNPTPNIFEALQNVNGVRPQINCSVCNTGDIHINGLEGPYTF